MPTSKSSAIPQLEQMKIFKMTKSHTKKVLSSQLIFKEENIMLNRKSAKFTEIQKKNSECIIRQPSKPLLTNQPQSGKFIANSNIAPSERSDKPNSMDKVRKTHVSSIKIIKPHMPTHKSNFECQGDFLKSGIPLADTMNTAKSLAPNVITGLEVCTEIASNKTVVHNTVTTVDTPINGIASNDTNYAPSATPSNITTLPSLGVLSQENTNLTASQEVKAKVKADRLAITSDVPPPQHEEVRNAASDMCSADKNGLHLRKQQSKHGDRYNHNYKIYDGKKYLGLLSLEPRQSAIRFMRLDFNPSKIGRESRKLVAQALRCLIGANTAEIISQSNITRFDIAVDLYDIDINDMLYFSSRPIHSSAWGKIFKNGKEVQYRIESQYLGSTESDLYFIVYDKRAERIAKSRGKDIPHESITRIEARVTPRITKGGVKTSLQLNNLELMNNPFSALSITSIPVPDADDGSFALFAYAAQHVGTHTALAMVKNPKKRSLYRKHLLGQAVSCWKSEEYWMRAIAALRKALTSLA